MRKKYYHQKLIRDKIPEGIKASGDDYETRVLGKTEFEKELKKKLVVLRLSAKFEEDAKKRLEGWTFLETPVNKDLAQYISGFDVRP
jgi:predicted house-cleaning noncanonical NTP pyrophosphatase (MazG superfamily)